MSCHKQKFGGGLFKTKTMDKPIHTHKTNYYKVLRPCLWFAKGDMIETSKFREYFTRKAIQDLQDYGFIQIIFNG